MDQWGWHLGHRRTPGVLVGAPGGGCLGRVQIPVLPEGWWVGATYVRVKRVVRQKPQPLLAIRSLFGHPLPLAPSCWRAGLGPVELASSMTAPSKGSVMGVDERYGFP